MQLTSLSLALTRAGFLSFSPTSLFAASEPGVWLDPSDFSTMFQDAAGTTPVTAVGQPVGLILDKSQGLVLGPELVTNGTFDSGIAGWTAGNAGQSVLTWEAGKIRVARVNAGDTYPNARTSITGLTAGRTYKIASTTNNPFGIEAYHSIAGIAASLVRTTLASKTMECVFTATATTHNLDVGIWSTSGAVGQYVEFDNISVRELPGNHATQTTSTSRPVLKQDGSGKYYLLFDGIDDWLVTPTITPGTDKAQVFAGVRVLSAVSGVLAELSANSGAVSGALLLSAPSGIANTYLYRSRGTLVADVVSPGSYTAPITNALTGISDVSGDSAILRIDGTQAAQSTADQGTGNYLAYPLYIGRRGGTTIPFNGHLYSLIVRFGANLPAGTIASTESWVAGKTGITL